MRVRVWLSAAGVALLVLGARETSGPAGAADTHSVTKPSPASTSSSDECILKAHSPTPPVPQTTAGGGTAPVPSGSPGSGNVVVEIPPSVFVRVDGRRLIVTTNTGESPQKLDTFYEIADGTAGLAGSGMIHHVLSKCTKKRWRPPPPSTDTIIHS